MVGMLHETFPRLFASVLFLDGRNRQEGHEACRHKHPVDQRLGTISGGEQLRNSRCWEVSGRKLHQSDLTIPSNNKSSTGRIPTRVSTNCCKFHDLQLGQGAGTCSSLT